MHVCIHMYVYTDTHIHTSSSSRLRAKQRVHVGGALSLSLLHLAAFIFFLKGHSALVIRRHSQALLQPSRVFTSFCQCFFLHTHTHTYTYIYTDTYNRYVRTANLDVLGRTTLGRLSERRNPCRFSEGSRIYMDCDPCVYSEQIFQCRVQIFQYLLSINYM